MLTCDGQIQNVRDLLHIDAIKVSLGGVTQDRAAHLPGIYSYCNYVIRWGKEFDNDKPCVTSWHSTVCSQPPVSINFNLPLQTFIQNEINVSTLFFMVSPIPVYVLILPIWSF